MSQKQRQRILGRAAESVIHVMVSSVRRKCRPIPPRIENLETRIHLASVTYDSVNHTVTFQGDNASETIRLAQKDASHAQLTVNGSASISGQPAAGFDSTYATYIVYANGGNDHFQADFMFGDIRFALYGGSGDDTLSGHGNNDTLYGGDGHDRLFGERGSDILVGNAGNDTYVFTYAPATENDVLTEFPGEGTDTLDFSGMSQAVTADLTVTTVATMVNRTVQVSSPAYAANVENINGGTGYDSLTGNAAANTIWGGTTSASDTISGLGGNDTLGGGAGGDRIVGGDGNDSIYGDRDGGVVEGDGRDWLYGGNGNDTICGELWDDFLWGDDGDDSVTGDAGDDRFDGGAGTDTLVGGADADSVVGGAFTGGSANEGSTGTVTFGLPDVWVGFAYSYDFNNDGTFEITGSTASSVTVPATYLADGAGSRTVRGRAASSADQTATITINNVAPTLTGMITVPSGTAEGSNLTFTSPAATDPAGASDPLVYNWTVKRNGVPISTPTTSARSLTFQASDNGSYVVSVYVTDGDGGASATLTSSAVVVSNVAPTTSLIGADYVNEGSAYMLTIGAITDPGQDTISQYTVRWGDGQTDTIVAASLPANRQVSHIYAHGAVSRVIQLDLTDEDGTYGNVATKNVTVNNVLPSVTLSGADQAQEGAAYILTLGQVIDTGDDIVTGYLIHWGDGIDEPYAAAQVAVANGQLSHVYADGPAIRTITLAIVDEDGTHANLTSKVVEVLDVAPAIALQGVDSVNEASPYTLALGPVADPGLDVVDQYEITWGDGSTPQEKTSAEIDATNRQLGYTYPDGPAAHRIVVGLHDEDGWHANAGSKTITIVNVPPTLTLAIPIPSMRTHRTRFTWAGSSIQVRIRSAST